jgi:colanic acid biosynthesis glycosyl transferase WcaI
MQPEQKPKRILFIGGNYFPEPTGIGKYNGEMVDLFAGRGFQCTVVTSFPYYPYWKVQKPYSKWSFWYKREVRTTTGDGQLPIEIFRCPQYVPRKPTGKTRMMLDLSFLVFSFFKIFQLLFRRKYDYVIAVVPCFQIGLLGIFYKWVRGAKFIYHIQDLQIDAASELKMISSKKAIRLLLRIERYILQQADIISSISAGMIQKINKKVNKEVVFFPNWVDTNLFYPLSEKIMLKEEFNLRPSDRIVLYSGAIGEKQGLESILHSASMFREQDDLKFLICGSGPYREKLEEMAKEEGLTNVLFLPLQPAERLNRFLNMADLHLVLQKANASDLVMPSKLSTILSVGGIAIVSAPADSTLHDLVSTNEMGVVIEPGNQHSLTEAIDRCLKNNYENVKRNARKYAEDFLSIEYIFSRYMNRIQ